MIRVMCSAAVALVVLGGCSGDNAFDAAKNEASASTVSIGDTEGSGENVFLPEGNLSDCVGTVERPNCGSSAKGGTGTYLTLGVLVLGLAFIFWRISIGIRKRDAVVNSEANVASIDAAQAAAAANTPPPADDPRA
jgi:hypothetical protein